jgi:hypothetical protein
MKELYSVRIQQARTEEERQRWINMQQSYGQVYSWQNYQSMWGGRNYAGLYSRGYQNNYANYGRQYQAAQQVAVAQPQVVIAQPQYAVAQAQMQAQVQAQAQPKYANNYVPTAVQVNNNVPSYFQQTRNIVQTQATVPQQNVYAQPMVAQQAVNRQAQNVAHGIYGGVNYAPAVPVNYPPQNPAAYQYAPQPPVQYQFNPGY